MRREVESFEILERALDAAGAEADAVFSSTDRNITRFANSNVHQNMSELKEELNLRVVLNDAMGVASTTSFDSDEIKRTADLAREAARHGHPLQNFSGLYRGKDAMRSLETFDNDTATIPPAAKAQALRTMFDRGESARVHFAGAYTTANSSIACANTHGIRRYARMTSADATVIAIAGSQSGYASCAGRSAHAVDVSSLGDDAVAAATRCAEKIETIGPGPYDVILEPAAIGEVLDWMNLITFCGQSYEDGSSFFVGNIGKKIVGENFTLVDDSNDESFFPFPFDLEGLPRKPITLIDRGVPRTPVIDKAYADRLKLPPTASAWHLGSTEHGVAFHLSIAAGDATRDELIRSTKRGIWVTRFNYVNGLLEPKTALMTGTTRDGTFLIRDGEVVARLPNLRWTQSMVEAFRNVDGLSRDRQTIGTWYNPFGGTRAPVMKVRGWNFTGKQEMS